MAKFLDEVGAQYMVTKIEGMIPDVTGVYRYKGTKDTYSEVTAITDKAVGDVWNIINADSANGIKAGDNVAWTGTEWDNLGGSFDMSTVPTTAITNAEIDAMFSSGAGA